MSAAERIARARSIAEFYLWRWYRIIFWVHDHDPGGCTCGCPVIGCYSCGDDRLKPIRTETTGDES